MIDIPITERLQFIGGFRRESTKMDVDQPRNFDPNVEDTVLIDEVDWLPSVNLRYRLLTNMNLRFAYGRTLARPNLREMAPFASDEHVGGYKYEGNAGLTYTKIKNYDMRWEWFTQPGEVLAVSAFYKRLKNPIEVVVLNVNGDVQPQNVDKATVYGLEFEWRTGLDLINESLSNFKFGGNLTLVHSVVDISEDELDDIRVFDSTWTTRELQGQSPYLINLDLTYIHPKNGLTTSFLYNVFGERYVVNGLDATPDIYEQPEHQLDFTMTMPLWTGVTVKIGAQNLLNERTRWIHKYKGKEYVHQEFGKGRSISFGMSYSL
jgi:TonB-dependent receptor